MNTELIKNVFEHSNARYMKSSELASEFIWTDSFQRLLNPTNHIILGARGSGKTVLVRMLSHENLASLKHPYAQSIISKKTFIATYIPLRIEWVSGIKDIDDSNLSLFKWCLNVSSCARFIDTIKSCINEYIESDIEKQITSVNISREISQIWFDKKISSLDEITQEISRIEILKNISFNKMKLGVPLNDEEVIIGISFASELFQPLLTAINILSKYIKTDESTTWSVCLDEAEFLEEIHHKLLNTHMRSYSKIIFKITTMPYRHYTLETFSNVNINEHHDFEYIYIDQLGMLGKKRHEIDDVISRFATDLFKKRTDALNMDMSLYSLLGHSELLDIPNMNLEKENVLQLILKHCDEKTIKRAHRLYDTPDFNDQIERKLRGSLILKDEYQNMRGATQLDKFSGVKMAIRCTDGNPRRLLNLFNRLFHRAIELNAVKKSITPKLSGKEQTKVFRSFSLAELETLKNEAHGLNAYKLIDAIGSYFKEKFHDEKITTDTTTSFTTEDSENNDLWDEIKLAVDLGLIFPDLKKESGGNKLPVLSGTFHLSFCLFPHYYLLPRRGRSIRLKRILNRTRKPYRAEIPTILQMELFPDD
ncbi:hypothetical protein ACEUCH_10975 [Aeromonas hydrophila]|uniref:ORC-CDC6 family AAA ATPase n=1 Tax=Aeromonas hydrophila TaxID=644 RepID=UPI0038D19544